MCLPGNRLFAAGYGKWTSAKQNVDSEPHDKEQNNTSIGQNVAQRKGRNPIGPGVGASDKCKRAATLECKAHCSRQGTGDRCRRPDHRKLLARMCNQMHRGSRRSRHSKKRQKAISAETACHCSPKRQKPDCIDAKMKPIRVDQSVGDEGPYIRAPTRERVIDRNRTAIASWNKGEAEQKFDVLLLAEHEGPHEVDNHQRRQYRHDNGGNIENWFALHVKSARWGTCSYAA